MKKVWASLLSRSPLSTGTAAPQLFLSHPFEGESEGTKRQSKGIQRHSIPHRSLNRISENQLQKPISADATVLRHTQRSPRFSGRTVKTGYGRVFPKTSPHHRNTALTSTKSPTHF